MISDDPTYALRLARDARDLHAAQRLRYRVFVRELGADGPLVDHARGLEQDEFDPLFDHLLLIDRRADPDAGDHVVGAYRLLPSDRVGAAGRFYSEAEYDLNISLTGNYWIYVGLAWSRQSAASWVRVSEVNRIY